MVFQDYVYYMTNVVVRYYVLCVMRWMCFGRVLKCFVYQMMCNVFRPRVRVCCVLVIWCDVLWLCVRMCCVLVIRCDVLWAFVRMCCLWVTWCDVLWSCVTLCCVSTTVLLAKLWCVSIRLDPRTISRMLQCCQRTCDCKWCALRKLFLPRHAEILNLWSFWNGHSIWTRRCNAWETV